MVRRSASEAGVYPLENDVVITGVVSVSPYPATHWHPGNADSVRSTSSGDEAAPPIMMRRRLERFQCGRSGQLISAFTIVGTRHISVAECSWIMRNTKVG